MNRKLLNALRITCAISTVLAARSGDATGYSWTDDRYTANPLPTQYLPGDRLRIDSGVVAPKILNTYVRNAGELYWNADNIGNSGGHLDNRGLFDITADATWQYAGGAGSSLDNSGTIRKSDGPGSTVFGFTNQFWDEFIFTNSGTLDAQLGTIEYRSPMIRFNTGTHFMGSGTHLIDSNDARFEGDFQIDPRTLVLFHGQKFIANTLARPTGLITWEGGDMQGNWHIPRGSEIDIVPAHATKRFAGASLNNDGEILIGDGLWLSSTTISNQGYLRFTGENFIQYSGGGGARVTNAVDGVISMDAPGTAAIAYGNQFVDELIFTNFGELQAKLPTSVLEYRSPMCRFYDGTRFTGPGKHVVKNRAEFAGVISATNLYLDSGNEPLFANEAIVTGTINWQSGPLTGAWIIQGGSTIHSSTANPNTLSGIMLLVGQLWLHNTLYLNGEMLNASYVTLMGTEGIRYPGSGEWGSWQNVGILKRVGAGGTSLIDHEISFTNSNTGMIYVDDGTILINSHNFTNNNGTVYLRAQTAVLQVANALSNHGGISGHGMVQTPLLTNHGTLGSEQSDGNHLTIASPLILASDGTVQLAVDSRAFCDVEVLGSVNVGGTLLFALRPGDPPGTLESEPILHAASRTGQFASIQNMVLEDGRRLAVTYDPQSVLATVTFAGDIDLDGDVDSVDFNTFVSHFGSSSSSWSMGDFTGEAKTDTLDFNLLAGSFGATAIQTLGTVAPEPVALCWITVPLFVCLRRPTLMQQGDQARESARSL